MTKKDQLSNFTQVTSKVPSAAQVPDNHKLDPPVLSAVTGEGRVLVSQTPYVYKTGVGIATQAVILQSKIDSLENLREVVFQSTAAVHIPLDLIELNTLSVRKIFCPEAFEALCLSIQAYGVLQPITIQNHSTELGRYELIAGERRIRAARTVGLNNIPCIIRKTTSIADLTIQTLAENIQRVNLTDYEISLALKRLQEDFPDKLYLAKSFGINTSQLARYKCFFNLEKFMRDDLDIVPSLINGELAAQLVALKIEPDYEILISNLALAWKELKDGVIEKNALIFRAKQLCGDLIVPTDGKDFIRTLFSNGEKIGFISKDNDEFTIQIQTAYLTSDLENELMIFIERLLTVE